MKNDDMEDMFRKAASNYELNEDMAADWNSVHAGLQDERVLPLSDKKEKKRKRFLLFWWFLLIPAGLFMAYETGLLVNKTKQSNTVSADNKSKALTPKVLSPGLQISDGKMSNINKEKMNDENKTVQTKRNIQEAIVSRKQFVVRNKGYAATVAVNNSSTVNDGETYKAGLSNNHIQSQTTDPAAGDTVINEQELKAGNAVTNVIAAQHHNNLSTGTTKETGDSTHNKTAENVSSKKTNKTTALNRKSYLYAGITGNIDLTYVKHQQTSQPGAGAGIVAGYHFKIGFSIESGVLLDKKNYYTSGNYFDKTSLGYLRSVQLVSVDGYCKMWEIPLNIRYDFKSKKKYNWFVSTGVSSYLMDKEFYNFTLQKDTSVFVRPYDYLHSSKNWLAVLNVGAGVNVQASKKYFIQVQPYYKIPLSGVGKGNLLLSSAGFNISFIRHIP